MLKTSFGNNLRMHTTCPLHHYSLKYSSHSRRKQILRDHSYILPYFNVWRTSTAPTPPQPTPTTTHVQYAARRQIGWTANTARMYNSDFLSLETKDNFLTSMLAALHDTNVVQQYEQKMQPRFQTHARNSFEELWEFPRRQDNAVNYSHQPDRSFPLTSPVALDAPTSPFRPPTQLRVLSWVMVISYSRTI